MQFRIVHAALYCVAVAASCVFQVRSIPLRKDDEVLVVRGSLKNREGKVTQVYRRKYIVQVAGLTKDKANGAFAPANCAY